MAFVRTRCGPIFLLLYLSWREALSQPCGGVLTERRGEVASPGYPRPGYPNRVRCTWEIRAGARDTVRVRMRAMRIEDDPTCRWDFLEVRFTGREPTRLCGSDMSRVPNGGVMQGRGETVLYLQSDDSVNDAGFLLNYEVMAPPCDSQPCQRGARCVEISQDDFRCDCPRGYTGKVCEIDIDECSPNPCQNGGRCVDGSASYTCECAQGFTGTRCETDIDECTSNPCRNGGRCVNGAGSFTCVCTAGFTGTLCDADIDECNSNPCQNGGRCVNGAGSFTCVCPTGFTGTLCDTDIDECASSPCLNGGRCRDGVAAFACECAAGFTGARCETALPRDPCQPNPCANGRCERQPGPSFRCACPAGFTGRLCESPIATPATPPPRPPPAPTAPPRPPVGDPGGLLEETWSDADLAHEGGGGGGGGTADADAYVFTDDAYDQLGSDDPDSGAEPGRWVGPLAEGPLAAIVLGSLGVAALLGVILAFRLGGRARPPDPARPLPPGAGHPGHPRHHAEPGGRLTAAFRRSWRGVLRRHDTTVHPIRLTVQPLAQEKAASTQNKPAADATTKTASAPTNNPAVDNLNQPTTSNINQPTVNDLNQPTAPATVDKPFVDTANTANATVMDKAAANSVKTPAAATPDNPRVIEPIQNATAADKSWTDSGINSTEKESSKPAAQPVKKKRRAAKKTKPVADAATEPPANKPVSEAAKQQPSRPAEPAHSSDTESPADARDPAPAPSPEPEKPKRPRKKKKASERWSKLASPAADADNPLPPLTMPPLQREATFMPPLAPTVAHELPLFSADFRRPPVVRLPAPYDGRAQPVFLPLETLMESREELAPPTTPLASSRRSPMLMSEENRRPQVPPPPPLPPLPPPRVTPRKAHGGPAVPVKSAGANNRQGHVPAGLSPVQNPRWMI